MPLHDFSWLYWGACVTCDMGGRAGYSAYRAVFVVLVLAQSAYILVTSDLASVASTVTDRLARLRLNYERLLLQEAGPKREFVLYSKDGRFDLGFEEMTKYFLSTNHNVTCFKDGTSKSLGEVQLL